MTRSIRKLHRCLGVFIGLQILFWTISGLYFSWNEIKTVRGENLVVKQSGLFLDDPAYVSPSKVISTFVQQNLEIEMIDQVTLRFLLDKPVYEIRYQQKGRVRYALANAFTGLLRSPIRKDEAVAIAHADFEPIAPVLSTDWIEAVKPGSEYRGRPLPAYRITFDHPIET
ncbi:MAG: peptidase M4, partial [Nitrospiria bacterium]